MIEIKHRWNGKVLYTAENAQDVQAALKEAVQNGVTDFTGADFSDQDFSDANFANFARANFARADFARANFAEAYFARANFAGANFAEADFARADFARANFAEAYFARANFAEAYFARANFAGANFAEADFARADFARANFAGANFAEADFAEADFAEADFARANHPLHVFRQDYWSILDQAPGEVAAVRQAIVDGRINGSVYSDGECGCLCGTIGICRADSADEEAVAAALAELGIQKNGSRPAEQWFVDIVKGDKPLPLDTKEWPSESVFRISCALAWLDEWLVSRTAIAAALNGPADA